MNGFVALKINFARLELEKTKSNIIAVLRFVYSLLPEELIYLLALRSFFSICLKTFQSHQWYKETLKSHENHAEYMYGNTYSSVSW